jgi:hypothetical protein
MNAVEALKNYNLSKNQKKKTKFARKKVTEKVREVNQFLLECEIN